MGLLDWIRGGDPGERHCGKGHWSLVMVELAREGAEAINLDRCTGCGRFRLSWWWPKDSAQTHRQSEFLISADDAGLLEVEKDWNRRKEIVERMLKRKL